MTVDQAHQNQVSCNLNLTFVTVVSAWRLPKMPLTIFRDIFVLGTIF